MSTSVTPPSVRPARTGKLVLWATLFLLALSVFVLTEIPILRVKDPRHAHFVPLMPLLIPHIIAGTLALVIGPFQFSTRLRQKNLQLHRMLGRVYVYSVFVAVPLALVVAWPSGLFIGTAVQASAWLVTTLAALLTARNRHIQAHRQWMIRSYAVTFTFVTLRVLSPWPAYMAIPDDKYASVIIIVTMLSVCLPDIAFNWRELTTKRG